MFTPFRDISCQTRKMRLVTRALWNAKPIPSGRVQWNAKPIPSGWTILFQLEDYSIWGGTYLTGVI